MFGLFLKATLAVLLAYSVRGQSIIYMDYTNGWSLQLPFTSNGIAESRDGGDTFSYSTVAAGSFSFGVDWNNDATDQFTINLPPAITLTPLNNATFCTPILYNPILFTSASVNACNYVASWNTSFAGVGTIQYEDPVSPGQSDAVSVFSPRRQWLATRSSWASVASRTRCTG